MNAQEQFWSGSFGDEYTKRNQVDWRMRVSFWRGIVKEIDGLSDDFALEVGCNAGANLQAIYEPFRESRHAPALLGTDINAAALDAAKSDNWSVWPIPAQLVGWKWKDRFKLTFTVGLLIHIGPDELTRVMENIVCTSYRYVLAVEYEADVETEVEYRGHRERLWKRPYGKLYEGLGLRLIDTGDAGPGFDRCTYWLMEKR